MKCRLPSKRAAILSLTGVAALASVAWGWKPLLVRHRMARARVALQQRNTESALEWLQANERLAPDDAETQFLLARAFRRLGQYDEVREHIARARSLGFPVETLKREQWLALAQSGQLETAERRLGRLLQNPRGDGREICEAYVAGYLLNYRFAAAMQLLEAWRKDFPGDYYPYLIQGRVFEGMSNTKRAIANYRQALERNPDQRETRLRLANLLLTLQQYEEAGEIYKGLLRDGLDDADILTGWSRWLTVMGRNDEAREVLRRILDRNAKHWEARLSMGESEMSAGRPQRALRWLKPAAREAPHDQTVRYALARALQRLGRTAEAKTHFDFVDKARREGERVQLLVERLDRDPTNLALRYEIGASRMKYGNPADGVAWLESVVQLDPRHSQARAVLAAHYERRGLVELAKRHRAWAKQP